MAFFVKAFAKSVNFQTKVSKCGKILSKYVLLFSLLLYSWLNNMMKLPESYETVVSHKITAAGVKWCNFKNKLNLLWIYRMRKIMAIWVMENSREGHKIRKVLSQTWPYFKKKYLSWKMGKHGLSGFCKIWPIS